MGTRCRAGTRFLAVSQGVPTRFTGVDSGVSRGHAKPRVALPATLTHPHKVSPVVVIVLTHAVHWADYDTSKEDDAVIWYMQSP